MMMMTNENSPHALHHPDLHPAASSWSEAQTLHVAACYSNPLRWRSRRELANDFRRHMRMLPNVRLHFIECAYGDRPFDVTDPSHFPDDMQVRTKSELFHKENLLNLVIQRFPADWQYGAIVDADFHFTRHDIGLETIHQLQHHAWVQMFSSYLDLDGEISRGGGHLPLAAPRKSFAATYVENDYKIAFGYLPNGEARLPRCPYDQPPANGGLVRAAPGATGGAWAFRREAFETCGGLLDRCILGSGDWFMAFGLVGDAGTFPFVRKYNPDYRHYIEAWQERASTLKKNIGYVDGFVVHHFHGPKKLRFYGTRDQILVDNQYSPVTDVAPDAQGVLQLVGNKPRMRDQIRAYFKSRNEDMPSDM